MAVAADDHAVRRALARAGRGQALTAEEATALLGARGEALESLLAIAQDLRDRGRRDAGMSSIVTYSPKVFIPVTRLCRDRCHYCTFATVPHRLPAPFLSPDEILDIARSGAAAGCAEALFTLGDRPEDRWPAAREWLDQAGYADTLSYVRAMAIRVLEETGLLPHLNPGVMSWEEMRRLRPVAPSMGMMLETTAERLWSEPGGPHFGSPDKEPRVRLAVLEDAGRLRIPFTTGILVGIGETPAERVDALLQLRAVHRRHGHIQEVIVQNFRAKDDTAMRAEPDLDHDSYLATIAVARVLLGPRMRIQAPPNLTDAGALVDLLRAGVDDWGGVSPLTPDHVNPERPWPHLAELDRATREAGFELRPRLTAHPRYVRDDGSATSTWIDPRLHAHVSALADDVGLLAQPCEPVGRPWQEPTDDLGAYADFASRQSGGRVDLHLEIDVVGRHGDRRTDFEEVYGDWAEVGERARAMRAPERLEAEVRDALALGERDPALLARPENRDAAIALMSAEGDALRELALLADGVRQAAVGDEVTYVVNRNINFTNVCYTGCRFCAFAQRAQDLDAFTLSTEEVGERVREAVAAGATEVCMQGGIHPDLPGTAYFELAAAVKAAEPAIHLHAFSPMEVVNGATRSGLSITEWLVRAKEAGLDSIPGTAAEILDDEVRWILTKGKLSADMWVEVVETAHSVGLPSTATMMFGHVDAPHHWVDHLALLRSIQERSGGFTEFVPLPFVHHQAPIYLAGVARPGPTSRDVVAVHAMARLMLDGAISHVQCSWVKVGDDGCRTLLASGADDVGGTLMEETISRMAGSDHGSARSVGDLEDLIRSAGRRPRQRNTVYGAPALVQRA